MNQRRSFMDLWNITIKLIIAPWNQPVYHPVNELVFPSQHHFNEKLQRKEPHLRASGSIYESGPEGREEAKFVFPFHHSQGMDGSRNLPFIGICMQVLSELVFVYVSFDGVRRALQAMRIQFPHNSHKYLMIGEAITRRSRCNICLPAIEHWRLHKCTDHSFNILPRCNWKIIAIWKKMNKIKVR